MTYQHEKSLGKGVLFMLLSAFFLSLSLLFIKFASYKVPFFWLVFVRYFIGLLCLVGVFSCQKRLLAVFKTKNFRFHLLRACVITVSQYCLIFYLSKSNLLNAAIFRNTAPFFIPVIELIFLGHRITKSTMISLLVSGVGLVLILKPGGDLFEWLSLYGLATGFLWAISQTIYGFTIRNEKMETSIFYVFFFGTLFTIPALLIFPISLDQLSGEIFHFQGIVIVCSIGICTLLNQYFRGRAYRVGKPTTLATFLYLSVVISGVFDWAFFQITPNFTTVIGSLLVIVGGGLKVYLRYIFLKKKKQ